MFSAQHMIDRSNLATIEPPLRFASDLYYLQYYRYWAVDRSHPGADPAGGSLIPPPKAIVIRSIHEDGILEYFREIKRRQGDFSPREGGRRWPGDRFTRDHDEFYVLMTSPMGQGVTWFLTQHKHIFGAKSVGRIRVWASSDAEDDFNMLFEIINPPPPDSDGEEAAGQDPPAAERRALTVRSTTAVARPGYHEPFQNAPKILHRRAFRARRARYRIDSLKARRRVPRTVDDNEWNSWLCFGRAMYDVMTAKDDTEAATIADHHPAMEKWKGKTTTVWHNPEDLGRFGWSVRSHALAEMDDIDTDGSVTGSGLSDDVDDWIELISSHDQYWKTDGLSAGQNDNKVCGCLPWLR